MRRTAALLATVWLTGSVPARHGGDPFAWLGRLNGSCWRGAFADRPATDTHCFETMLGGRFIRDQHVVEGDAKPYLGETIYRPGRTGSDLDFHYFNSLGQVTTGRGTIENDAIVFHERLEGATGTREFRTTWAMVTPDRYQVRTDERRDGRWTLSFSMTLERVPAAESKGWRRRQRRSRKPWRRLIW